MHEVGIMGLFKISLEFEIVSFPYIQRVVQKLTRNSLRARL